MYCLGCEYELAGLEGGCCPECGRAFDAGDSRTFSRERHSQLRDRRARPCEIALIAAATTPLVANLMAHAALVAARVSLGRWPHRFGADDPKGVAGIGLFYGLAMLALLASPVAALVGLLMAALLVVDRAWVRLLRGGLIAACLWGFGILLTQGDPAQVWVWLFD
ncbi:MAG: hypothetical protein ACF8R7_09410 [Phycisphaerales bacterium JB039]